MFLCARRGAGVVELACLENKCACIKYRGFESLSLRHYSKNYISDKFDQKA